ncbi:CBS domain-containing membrane protein [Pseudorhodobacter antarcticus]|uniref:CBS domain-containing membrane protein n=1 Tax=Pseudorhodobacter antarcticus TaxID=1077947 RepID=A0A1H8ITR5_9RHOB|nr:HPP family protein [Pseudorhodobacter antarcticus]SEN71367.1 CBS domain-containing membrane protein [Pseudorhodobacter antarcticus]
MTRLRRIVRALGPAVGPVHLREMLRACIGAGIGLTLCTFLVRWTTIPASAIGLDPTLLLIAPLGATAMLAFAVPSSPLAQPWPALVGNTVSALVGVAVVVLVAEPWLAMGLSVTLAMMAMMVLRATHPPAAGVALGVVLTAETVREVGFSYAFSPVMLDTGLLLIVAMLYNRLTGRMYPFRQPVEHVPRAVATKGLRPGVEGAELTAILQNLRLDANIGAGDLARLIEAAHGIAAQHLFDGVAAGQLMARGVISAHPQMPVSQIAALFRQHKVRTLPVVGFDGVFQGLVSEADLVRTWHDAEGHAATGVVSRLLRASREGVEPVAAEMMTREVATAQEATPLGTLIDLLADGAQQAVPVLDAGRLIGLVTRADLIAALARAHHPEGA